MLGIRHGRERLQIEPATVTTAAQLTSKVSDLKDSSQDFSDVSDIKILDSLVTRENLARKNLRDSLVNRRWLKPNNSGFQSSETHWPTWRCPPFRRNSTGRTSRMADHRFRQAAAQDSITERLLLGALGSATLRAARLQTALSLVPRYRPEAG